MTDTAISAGSSAMQPAQTAEIDIVHGRLFEWFAALFMIGAAVTLTIWPKSFDAHSLQVLVNEIRLMLAAIGLDSGRDFVEPILRSAFLAGGLIRCFALYANGHWPVIGPRLRGAGAGAGALLWSQMSFAVMPSLGDIGSGALAVVLYGLMACCEIVSCYRSGAHGRWRR